jgi:exosortase
MIGTTAAEGKPGPGFMDELVWYWQQWPGKAVALTAIVAWVALFQFLGNSTFGYIDTHSLFSWMNYSYLRNPDDEHGYLIPIVVLVVFWWKRAQLLELAKTARPSWPALGLLVLALGLHIIAYAVQQTRISIAAFFLGLYALFGLLWGGRFMRASFFPMALFVFAIPLSTVSEVVTYPLRLLVTKISVGLGHEILGMPIGRNGSQILNLADGVAMYDVAPACSGIRSLTALGAVTMIFAFTGFSASWKRLIVLLSAFPLAVAGNTARVTALLILGDAFGRDQAMRLEQYLGLITFAVALGCLLALGRWLGDKPEPESQQPGTTDPPVPVRVQGWAPAVVALGLLLTAGIVLLRIGSGQHLGKPGLRLAAGGQENRMQGISLPEQVLDYTSKPLEVTPLEVGWLPKDTVFGRRLYESTDGFAAQLSVVLMGTDRTSIHKPQYCLDGQGWRIEKSKVVSIPIQQPYPYELQSMKLSASKMVTDKDGNRRLARGLYVYWFVADGELTASHGERMWWMARDLIRKGVLQRWAYVSYFTAFEVKESDPTQEDRYFGHLKHLIAASIPEFQLACGPRLPAGNTVATAATEKALAN